MEQEATYIKGFNSGYKMAEYNPALWEKLKPSLSKETSDYERGVLEGAEEFERMQTKDREQDIENIQLQKAKGKDLDLSL
jgi:hypothetical protein